MALAASQTKNVVSSEHFTMDLKIDYDIGYTIDLPSMLGNF